MIVFDGSGSDSEHVLRTALTLAMVTGEAFRLDKVGAGRKRTGLLRPHLASIAAAKAISSAKVTGGDLLSTRVSFEPGKIAGGEHAFAIGATAAVSDVLLMVLPALLAADHTSVLTFTGCTHVNAAPTIEEVAETYVPLLARMGGAFGLTLVRHGFHPAGGGIARLVIEPCAALQPLVLEDAGAVIDRRIVADVAHIGYDTAEREAQYAAGLLSWLDSTARARTVKADSPGNVVSVTVASEHVTAMFTAFGERGLSSEAVAAEVAASAQAHMATGAAVSSRLAEMLLVPMAMAKGGRFVTTAPSPRTLATVAAIEKFLPVEFQVTDLGNGRWRIAVE